MHKVDKDSEHFTYVRDQFQKNAAPFYGSQKIALDKIGKGVDRTCRVLFEENNPKGLIVTKRILSDEYRHLKIANALELKSLIVSDGEIDETGTKLLRKAEKVALRKEASGIFVTVSQNRADFLTFLKDEGFLAVKSFPDKYQAGVTEVLLHKSFTVPKPSDYAPITLRNIYINQIIQKRKTIEGRINSGVFAGLLPGSRIRFFAGEREVFCLITEVTKFATFKEMLEKTGYKNCLPDARSLEAAGAEYAAIPGYPEREKSSGVVALKVQVEPKPEEKKRHDEFEQPEAKRKK